MAQPIKVGDRVRFSARFLRSTGQYTGSDGHATFTVLDTDREYLVLDQPTDPSVYFSPEELAAMSERDRFLVTHRRAHRANMVRVGQPDHS